MPVSEAVTDAKADLGDLGPQITTWVDDFIELLDRVSRLDLVFQEVDKMDLNYVALCPWDDPSNLVIIHTVPQTQTAEQRKRTLATASILAALLHRLGYFDVAVALLADDIGKIFRHEGIVGHSKTIRGCPRVLMNEWKFDS